MKCKFCGKRIKKNSNMCEYCGKEINEGMNTEELIDAMPEIRDEFDKISELQEKEKKKEEKKEKRAQGRKKRIIAAVLIIAAILACVVGGIYYYNDKAGAGQPQEPVLTTTAIDSQFQKSFAGEGFTNLAISSISASTFPTTPVIDSVYFANCSVVLELSSTQFEINSSTAV